MNQKELKQLFTEPILLAEQTETLVQVRKMCYNLAGTMLVNSPTNTEQTIAIRRIHEALYYFELSLSEGNEKPAAQAHAAAAVVPTT